MGDVITDYDWDLDRFVEFKSPLTRNKILSPGNNSSHWNRNKNNSSVMTNNHPKKKIKLKNQDRIIIVRVGTEIVIFDFI